MQKKGAPPMGITITTLIENNPSANDSRLFCEHGLSLYIELPGTTMLFDTGQSGDFVQNAANLEKDLSIVDYILISHGHFDHSGGVCKLIETGMLNPQTKMIVGSEFFNPKYSENKEGAVQFSGVKKKLENTLIGGKSYSYIGNEFQEEDIKLKGFSLKRMEEDTINLTEDIIIFHHFKQSNDFEKLNTRFVVEENGHHQVDSFKDEISIGIKTDKGLVLIVGCSHIGIVNIMNDVLKQVDMPIYMIIGGTHLVEADEGRVDKTIEAFKKFGIKKMAVSHCTGEIAIEKLKNCFKDDFVLNVTGNVITI